MKRSTIDCLMDSFSHAYQFIYENECDYMEILYSPLVDIFDDLRKNDPDFQKLLNEFARARQDLITSDREAAAFMLAIRHHERIRKLAELNKAVYGLN